jgi:hypothetical protein
MRANNYNALLKIVVMSLFLAFLAATMSYAQAEHRSLPTRHVREEVVTGLAPLVSRLPATQRIGLAVMLPLHSQAELDNLLQELYDPSTGREDLDGRAVVVCSSVASGGVQVT